MIRRTQSYQSWRESKDPVWEIDPNRLGPNWRYVPDSPTHGTIQPVRPMTIEEYRRALANTRVLWRRHNIVR